jgi:hypothetical protein
MKNLMTNELSPLRVDGLEVFLQVRVNWRLFVLFVENKQDCVAHTATRVVVLVDVVRSALSIVVLYRETVLVFVNVLDFVYGHFTLNRVSNRYLELKYQRPDKSS